MTQEITFTREDADRITRMETLLLSVDKKTDDIIESIKTNQDCCVGIRDRFDKRVKTLEESHTEETGFLKGRKADFALVMSLLSTVVMLIAIYSFFHGKV